MQRAGEGDCQQTAVMRQAQQCWIVGPRCHMSKSNMRPTRRQRSLHKLTRLRMHRSGVSGDSPPEGPCAIVTCLDCTGLHQRFTCRSSSAKLLEQTAPVACAYWQAPRIGHPSSPKVAILTVALKAWRIGDVRSHVHAHSILPAIRVGCTFAFPLTVAAFPKTSCGAPVTFALTLHHLQASNTQQVIARQFSA